MNAFIALKGTQFFFYLQLCNDYRTISLISRPSKVMLKNIVSRLLQQAEEIIVVEKTDVGTKKSTEDFKT